MEKYWAALEAAVSGRKNPTRPWWYQTLTVGLKELETAREAIARVRALHCDLGGGYCEECSGLQITDLVFHKVTYPCPTVRALEEQA